MKIKYTSFKKGDYFIFELNIFGSGSFEGYNDIFLGPFCPFLRLVSLNTNIFCAFVLFLCLLLVLSKVNKE